MVICLLSDFAVALGDEEGRNERHRYTKLGLVVDTGDRRTTGLSLFDYDDTFMPTFRGGKKGTKEDAPAETDGTGKSGKKSEDSQKSKKSKKGDDDDDDDYYDDEMDEGDTEEQEAEGSSGEVVSDEGFSDEMDEDDNQEQEAEGASGEVVFVLNTITPSQSPAVLDPTLPTPTSSESLEPASPPPTASAPTSISAPGPTMMPAEFSSPDPTVVPPPSSAMPAEVSSPEPTTVPPPSSSASPSCDDCPTSEPTVEGAGEEPAGDQGDDEPGDGVVGGGDEQTEGGDNDATPTAVSDNNVSSAATLWTALSVLVGITYAATFI